MRDRTRQFGIVGSVVLAVMGGAAWGQGHFETQVKTITVIDANGAPVPDALVYQGECLVWDGQTQGVRLTDEEPWQHTDTEGTFSFEFVRQGNGRSYFVTDAGFEQMACLYIARKDPNESVHGPSPEAGPHPGRHPERRTSAITCSGEARPPRR